MAVTDKDAERFWAKVDVINDEDSCWEWQAYRSPNGYGMFRLGRATQAHRVGFMIQSGMEIPPGMDVCHRCDNPPCVRGSHLWLGRRVDNVHDAIMKNRHDFSGLEEERARRSLDEAQVRGIEDALQAELYTQGEVAELFGVSLVVVNKIANGRHPRQRSANIRQRG